MVASWRTVQLLASNSRKFGVSTRTGGLLTLGVGHGGKVDHGALRLRLNEGGRRDSARSYSAPPMKIGCPLQCRQGGDDRAGREEQLEGVHAGGVARAERGRRRLRLDEKK